MKKILLLLAVLIAVGAAAGGAQYYVYPVQVNTLAAMGRNYLLSWSAPPGTATTELNAAYKAQTAAPPLPETEATSADMIADIGSRAGRAEGHQESLPVRPPVTVVTYESFDWRAY